MKRFVFAVGSSGGKHLEATRKDAASFYTSLLASSIGACHQDSPQPLLGCQSIDHFNKELNSLLRNWDKEDQFIFYYSGHGEIRKNKYCLVLGDTPVDLLTFDSLAERLELSYVEKAIIVLDACAAGKATKGSRDDIDSSLHPECDTATLPNGMAIIASSGPAQFSWENETGDASVFTEVVLKVLRDGISNGEEFIFIEDLVEHVTNTIKSDARYADFQQSPVFSVRASERIWLAHNTAYSKSTIVEAGVRPDVYCNTDLELLAIDKLREEHPSKLESLDELDWGLISKYRDASDGLDDDSKAPATREDLKRLGLLSPVPVKACMVPHRSAVLCFCNRPDRFHPESIAIYLDMSFGNNFVREEIRGPLIDQLITIQDLIKTKLNIHSFIDTDGKRQEQPEVDLELFREILANAFVHRDFSVTGNVEVRVKEGWVEISNPGGLLAGKEFFEVLENTYRSVPRNPVLMLLMNRLRRTEQIGRGFELIRKWVRANGKASIQCFESTGPITIFRLRRRRQNYITKKFIEQQAKPGESYEEARQRLERVFVELTRIGLEPLKAIGYIDNQGEEAVLRRIDMFKQRLNKGKRRTNGINLLIRLLDIDARKKELEEQKKKKINLESKDYSGFKQDLIRSECSRKIRLDFIESLSSEEQASLLEELAKDLWGNVKSLQSPLLAEEINEHIENFNEKLEKELIRRMGNLEA